MNTPEQDELQKTQDALNQIDSSTTIAGAAITTIAANQAALLQKISDLTAQGVDSLPQIQALTAQAQGEASKLADVATFMTQVASQGADNPVPVPAPVVEPVDPTPVPDPPVDPTPTVS